MPASKSDSLARDVRKFVFDHFVEQAVPPVLEQIMERYRLHRDEAFAVLKGLEDARHVKLVPGTQRILMAFPFSAVATPFRVTRPVIGRRYYANCAWDAVAFHSMLHEIIRIEGRCHHCAEPISIELAGGKSRASPAGPLIYLALPASQWWNDIVLTCSNHMVFFSSWSHLDEWRRTAQAPAGTSLTVEETHALSVPIYKDKLRVEYVRPAKDELVAHFRSLGLTGEFWRL
jgi:Alkylmercury lyase